MDGSLTTGSHLTHPNRKLSYSEPANDWRPLQRSARSTSQAPLFHSQPRSNSLVSLLTSLFLLTHTSRLYLNHVSITFAPFATSDQFLVKAPSISSPALMFLPGWTMPMPVCLTSQTRIHSPFISLVPHSLIKDISNVLQQNWRLNYLQMTRTFFCSTRT